MLPERDLWPSPLVRGYVSALLSAQQLQTAKQVLDNIIDDEQDGYIWFLKAHLYKEQYQWEESLAAAEKSLAISPDYLPAWHHAVDVHRETTDDAEAFKALLARIPDSLLAKQHDLALELIFELTINGDYARAESVLMQWFIENPEGSARAISDFNFTALRIATYPIEPVKELHGIIAALRFRIEDRKELLLIYDQGDFQHPRFLSATSTRAKKLLAAEPGEAFIDGMEEVELLEKMPPFIGVLHIVSELRQANQDDDDFFVMFTPPSNPEELIPWLEKRMFANRQQRDDESFLKNPQIPMYCKVFQLKRHEPFMGALQYFSNKKPYWDPIPNYGEEKPKQIVLDVFSISYLGLTGLYAGLEALGIQPVITFQTKRCLEGWLDKIENQEYAETGFIPGRGMIVRTSESIKEASQKIQDCVKWCLVHCEETVPDTTDAHEGMLVIRDKMDVSVYSSFVLARSNKIPWFCLDHTISQLAMVIETPIVNINQLLIAIGQQITFEQKKEGLYLHACQTLPYVLFYDDVYAMAASKDKHSEYFLDLLLTNVPLRFSSIQFLLEFSTKVLIPLLKKAYEEGRVLENLPENDKENVAITRKIFHQLCLFIIRNDTAYSAEKKLTGLLAVLLSTFQAIPLISDMIMSLIQDVVKRNDLKMQLVLKHLEKQLTP